MWRAVLTGLKAANMNGKAVTVSSFDKSTDRYVVKMPGGNLRKVKAANLKATDRAPAPLLSVCNVFARHHKLNVALVSESGKRTDIIHALDYQQCSDLEELPSKKGSLSFTMGSQEVASTPLDSSEQHRGKEITVYRSASDSNEVALHQNYMELDDGDAFYLHLVNGYSGSRKTKLTVERGGVAKVLPLNKSYRLEKLQDMSLFLEDGVRRLKLSFRPKKARTYMVLLTGSAASSEDDVDSAGLVLHEAGAWTSAETVGDEA